MFETSLGRVQISINHIIKGARLPYILLGLLLMSQTFLAVTGRAAATYSGQNGQVIAAEPNQLVAFDPQTFDEEVVRSFSPDNYVLGASTNSTGEEIAYMLQTASGSVELRAYNRQSQSDQLIRTYGPGTDDNGDYPPGGSAPCMSSISPDGNYIALTTSDVNGEFVLQIVRISDGSLVGRYTNARVAVDWSSDSAKVFATSEVNGVDSFDWFNTDGSGRTVVIPSSSLPVTPPSTGGQSVATSLSPDGEHILYITTANALAQIREIDLDASNDHLLVGNTDNNIFPLYGVFSPDSQRFVYERLNNNNGSITSATYITESLNGDTGTQTTSPTEQIASSLIWSPALPADTQPPVVSGTPDRAPNSSGWYNADVTISWQATDPSPSSGTPTTPPNTIASQEGKDVAYLSQQSCDPAGNCATGSLQISIDKTSPVGTFSGPAYVIRLLGNNINGTASDTLSGVDEVVLQVNNLALSSKTGGIMLTCNNVRTSCTWSVADASSLPLGLSTYTLSITDAAGNNTTEVRSYLVI